MKKMQLSRRRFLQLAALGVAWLATIGKARSAKNDVKETSTKPKVVVIGAGLGGLCCGAHLARQGFPVTVVEQHHIPGGYATAFRRGRFNFEVSLHGTAIANNAMGRMLEALGVSERLELVELPAVYRLITPDLDISVPQRDPDAYVKLLAKHFPAEEADIAQFVNDMTTIATAVDNLSRYRNSPLKLLISLPYWTLLKVRNKTLAELLNGYVKAPVLREALAAQWGYYGLPPSKMSAFYYAVATGAYLKDGSYYIRPRSQSLSTALVDVIEAAGGKVQFGTTVEKITVRNGSVEGVALSDGAVLPAGIVVSNANAPDIFNKMLPQGIVPDSYYKKLAEYRPSLSTFIVWLGLNKNLRGIVKNYNSHVSTGSGPEDDYRFFLNGEVDSCSFIVTLYDNLFDGYSEPGTSTMQIVILSGYEPWRRFEADYKAGRKEAYYEQKEEWTDTLIRRAEAAVVPGLSSMIEVKEAATPLTNWRFTRNPEGAIYGYEQATNNAFYNRLDNRTPIGGLYLASAWGNPGGGFVGVLSGGEMAFQNIIEDWGG